MDVFISEEYINRRRLEKKAATVAGKSMRFGSASSKTPEKRNSYPRISESPPDNEFRVTGGVKFDFDKKKMSYDRVPPESYPPPGYQSHYPPPGYPSAPPPPGYPSPPSHHEGYPPPQPYGGYPPPSSRPYEGGYQGYFAGGGYPHQHHGPPPPPPPQNYDHCHHDHHHYQDSDSGCFSFIRGCLAALCCCCLLEECCF
ncbi:Contains weak similarity to GATA-6 DNA-binding protein from Homo sapiens gb/X95701. ESTs gb/N38392, gb/AI998367, gb/H36135, gb/Z26200 come from this gene [Arabidopsis thaliana]|uniref:F13K23.6 protein n=5 Tax=Arabidopsis TaxID=3701 RepID=Q9LPW8_ARATH|nr:Contains weak similarity to GATA-6 DNA-binding protein from Homo sapiens gb/X95701. ESTs gb/N38392, gb/AI998367, gb/H36135, gb/Z26200 come from this gene [Arabidopsis thaliana]